jgi:ERCC4-type nuclease
VVVDGREKAPYQFCGLRADANLRRRPLVVPWEWAYLETGDYSVKGHEGEVAVERKSLADLYTTLGQHRDRFEAEHERLSEMQFAAVVIEASWETILKHPPEFSKLQPKSVYRTALSWAVRYRVPWFAMPGRRAGEVTTFRLLERWWRAAKRNKEDHYGRD